MRLLPAYGPGGRGLQLCRGGPRGRPRPTRGAAPEEPLTAAAETFTTGETWPALVLHRTPERCTVTALHQGRQVATHTWDADPPPPTTPTVQAVAGDLARLYRLADPRPLAHILRATGDPVRHQSDW